MDLQKADAIRREVMAATESSKLIDLSLQQLENYYNSLDEVRPYPFGSRAENLVAARLDLLRREIELKRVEERSDRQHKQTIRIGRKTLVWAIVAALGSVGLLLLDIPFSKLRHAITSLAWPASSPTTTATVATSPTPTAALSPSPTTPTSPMPSVTATPIKLPPPAP